MLPNFQFEVKPQITFIVTFFLPHTKAVHLVGFVEFQILRVSWLPKICVFLNAVNSTKAKTCIINDIHSLTKAEIRNRSLYRVVLSSQNKCCFFF